MNDCICSSCKNLKSLIDENENDNGITETCEFGFPSEDCIRCEVDQCDLTCAHYEQEQEVDCVTTSKCSKCGMEIKHISKDQEVGEIYCVACYLSK